MQAGSVKTSFLKWCLGEVFGQKTSIKELQHGNLQRGADTCYPAQPPSCHNGACGATKQQDLTYAMSALHLLSRFPFMQVDILAFLNLLSHAPHCLEKNPQNNHSCLLLLFLTSHLRLCHPSGTWAEASAGAGALDLQQGYPAHWYCIISPMRPFNHPDDDSSP